MLNLLFGLIDGIYFYVCEYNRYDILNLLEE